MIQYLVVVGAVVQLVGIASYIRATVRGETKPNRVSWLLWSIAPMIATAAALSDHVTWAVLPVFMSGFGPLLVFIASFANKNSYWKLERFDYWCGVFSLIALILWMITKNPLVAIIFAIMSDLLAGIPTLIKAWARPETERSEPYVAGVFNSATSFAAIRVWTFSSYGFAAYLVVMNILLTTAALHKKRKTIRAI